MALSQKDRLIRIATTLGDSTFIVLTMDACESISAPFIITKNRLTFL